VGEAVRLFARIHKGPTDVDSALSEWGLRNLRRRAYATLSGGQQQRLFLALALLGRPEIVFLDELTTGLDPTSRRATWNLVRQVRDRGATVVLVTHFMEEAEALCDRVAVVDRGRVVALDTPGALTAHRGGPVRMTFSVNDHDASYLSAVPGVDAVTIDAGRVTVTGSGTATVAVAAALAAHDVLPADYRTHHPSLEDVFLALTGRSLTDGSRS
jgi:ABC-2 type transport system ATP-binding protein